MSQRRLILPNVIYFVTSNTKYRLPFLDNKNASKFISALKRTKSKHPFRLFGFVIIPDHIHLLFQPQKRETISKIMLCLKRSTAFEIGDGPIWQPRFHDHIIRNKKKFNNHLNYIYFNLIKHEFRKNNNVKILNNSHLPRATFKFYNEPRSQLRGSLT